MKYSIVRQFSNGALDNLFNFFFRWVDFGKMLLDLFWAFLSIWQAFLGIFYNIFMYIYYLFLFFIDRGAEEPIMPRMFRQPIPERLSSTPPLKLGGADAAPIPSRMASSMQTAAESISSAASNVSSSVSDVISSAAPAQRLAASKSGGKKSIFKSIGEASVSFLEKTLSVLKRPFILISEFFSAKMKPVKEDDSSSSKNSVKRSLIDEYMKEYERQRK